MKHQTASSITVASKLKVNPIVGNIITDISSLFAALITDVAYGIQIKEENDPYIEILEEAMNAVGEAAVPGRYLVEIFPIMNYIPSWFPGANWKRKAAYVKELNIRVSQEPIEIVKENLVRE